MKTWEVEETMVAHCTRQSWRNSIIKNFLLNLARQEESEFHTGLLIDKAKIILDYFLQKS